MDIVVKKQGLNVGIFYVQIMCLIASLLSLIVIQVHHICSVCFFNLWCSYHSNYKLISKELKNKLLKNGWLRLATVALGYSLLKLVLKCITSKVVVLIYFKEGITT